MNFNDLRNLVNHYEQSVFPKMLSYYKKYYWDLSERKQYIKDWQSNQPAKILARIVDTFWSRIYDNKFKFYISPNNDKDVKLANTVKDLLTWAMQVSNLRRKFWLTAKDALITGEGYWRIKYTIKREKVEYINPNKWKKEFYMKDLQYPDYTYISPFNIMVDPTAPTFDDARYVVYRRVMTPEQVKSEYSWLGIKEDVRKFIWQGEYLYITDWLLLKNNSLYPSSVINIDTDNNTISFDPKKYVEVIEYWEDDRLIIYINWQKIYEWDNPLPIKKIPFIQTTYIAEPWSPRGLGLGFQLEHIEDIWTAITNAFIDDMKLKSIPVYKRKVGMNPLTNQNLEIDIKPWDTIMVEDENDLTVMELWRLNYDLQNLYNFLLNEAMMIAGVNDIVMWGPLQKVDRSATSTSWRIESFKARTLNFFDSINISLWKIAEHWLAMIIAYNKGWKFKFKVFDENKKKTFFETIKLEDIEWQFDIIFDTQALKSALRDVALQKKMNFLQIAWSLAVDPISRQPIIDLKKLVQEIGYDLDLPDVLITEAQLKQQQQQLMEQQQQIGPEWEPWQTEQPQVPQQDNVPPTGTEWEPWTEAAQLAKQLLQQALNPNR